MTVATGGTAAPATTGIVFGVDVLPVARAEQLSGRYDTAFAARIGTPGEVAWASSGSASGVRLGAVLAMKEAAVKAMGGRPEPFVWQQISTGGQDLSVVFPTAAALAGQPGGWPGPVADLFAGFASGLDLTDICVTTCAPAGPARDRLHNQLGDGGRVSGAACFAVRDDHIFAAVCFWREADDE